MTEIHRSGADESTSLEHQEKQLFWVLFFLVAAVSFKVMYGIVQLTELAELYFKIKSIFKEKSASLAHYFKEKRPLLFKTMMAALGLVLASMTSLMIAMLHEREQIFAMLEYGNGACETCDAIKLE